MVKPLEGGFVVVVSFDLEGTLVNRVFSDLVWNWGVPELYAERWGLSFSEDRKRVLDEYAKVGDGRVEWYDIKYWFNRFGLSDHRKLLEKYRHKISYYPEVEDVLRSLSMDYTLVLATNSARDIIDFLADKVRRYFSQIFSATSDFKCLKRDGVFYEKMCRALNVKPESVVHVGDGWEDDFLAPRRVGINAFHLDGSGRTACKFTVKNLKEFEFKVRAMFSKMI